MKMEARLEFCSRKARIPGSHQKLEDTRTDSPLESLEGVWP